MRHKVVKSGTSLTLRNYEHVMRLLFTIHNKILLLYLLVSDITSVKSWTHITHPSPGVECLIRVVHAFQRVHETNCE